MKYQFTRLRFLNQFMSTGFALSFGLLGGIALFALNIPIPFLLGSVLVIIFANKCGVTFNKPNAVISRWMRVIIGVALGSSVGGNLNVFSLSTSGVIFLAIFYTIVITLIGMRFFKRLNGFSTSDLFISSLPGGLSFLISLASNIGEKFPKMALIHTTRVVTLVFVLSAMSYFIGVDNYSRVDTKPFAFTFSLDLLPIVLTVIVSGVIAEFYKGPAGHVIFGLVLSTIAYSQNFIKIPMPEMMITLAMAFLGVLLGTSMMQGTRDQYPKIISLSITFTFIALAIGMLIAFGIVQRFDEQFLLYFLALAPGGIAEISLITIALGLDAGLVIVVHASRLFFIISMGAIGMNFFNKKSSNNKT